MALPIPEGYELLPGRSRENALKALSQAAEGGFDASSVLTRGDGYLIPLTEAQRAEALAAAEEAEALAAAEEAEALAAAEGAEAVEEAEAEEIEIPDADKASHADIDAFAGEWGLSYDDIVAENADKPTKAEKVAHLTKALEAKAAENDARLAATGELTGKGE